LAQSLGSSQFRSHRFVVICSTCSTLAHRLSDVRCAHDVGHRRVPCLTDTHHWHTAAAKCCSMRKIWNQMVSSVSCRCHGRIQQYCVYSSSRDENQRKQSSVDQFFRDPSPQVHRVYLLEQEFLISAMSGASASTSWDYPMRNALACARMVFVYIRRSAASIRLPSV
jgi:hypothetical protein